MSSLDVVLLLSVLAGVATLLKGLDWVFEKANAQNQQRLALLKAGLLLMWILPVALFQLQGSDVAKVVGTLMPSGVSLGVHVSEARAQEAITSGAGWRWTEIIVALYVAGASVLLGGVAFSYWRACRLLVGAEEAVFDGVKVRICRAIHTPLSFGLFAPKIFVPENFLESRTPNEIRLILAHEATHIANRDLLWKFVSLVTRSSLFFVPFAHSLHRALELAMEIECDRGVLEKTGASVKDYGSLLIEESMAASRARRNPAFAYMSDSTLRRRIIAMKAKTTYRPVLSFLATASLLFSGFAAVAAVSQAEKTRTQYLVKAEILLDGKIVSTPRIVSLENETASIEQGTAEGKVEFLWKLTASDATAGKPEDGIRLDTELFWEKGERRIHSRPKLVVKQGEPALITLNSDANQTVEIKLTAERL